MQDNYLVEIFRKDYSFLSKALVKAQKYEFDYMALGNNTLVIPGFMEVYKRDYIQMTSDSGKIQGIVTSVEYKAAETSVKYKPLLSLLDVDVYKERKELQGMTAEQFLGVMVQENFIDNSDPFQNIPGFSVHYSSETPGATLNLTDNIHNIYDLALKAFRKYGIVIDAELDVMGRELRCTIGKREHQGKTIEGDLKNVLEVSISLKDDEESVNKAVIVGEYGEDDPLFGQTLVRTYYLDKVTGLTTQTPEQRVEPVVFRYKTITIDAETFEEDAYEEAYDLIYQEKYDNSIKVKIGRKDSLYKRRDFHIGQKCTIIKNGERFESVFTGYKSDLSETTLLFGIVRLEYKKNMRRKR